MSIFASLLEINNSMVQTKMPPYSTYQHAWNEDSITAETRIDAENDSPAWINNAKDRTLSIIANLDSLGEPAQPSEFYNSETFKSRFGQEPATAAEPILTTKPSHTTPTITEGQETLSHVCSCCQLPLAPSTLQATQPLPQTHWPKDLCCACYCPDIKMPKEMMGPVPSQKRHIRRKSSLSNEESVHWHRKHHGEIECADRESIARNEMSIGSWL